MNALHNTAAIAAGGAIAGGLASEVVGKLATERLLTRFPHLRGKPRRVKKHPGRPSALGPVIVRSHVRGGHTVAGYTRHGRS